MFKGKSQAETELWLVSLKQAMQRSDGWGKNFSYLPHYPRFWRVSLALCRRTTRARQSSGATRRPATCCSSADSRTPRWCSARSPWTSTVGVRLCRSRGYGGAKPDGRAAGVLGQRGFRRGHLHLGQVRFAQVVQPVRTVSVGVCRVVHRKLQALRTAAFLEEV